MGCVLQLHPDSVSITFLSLRSTVLLAHVALWVATFRKRNLGDAAVLHLVIREGAYIVLILVGQYVHSILTMYLPLLVSRYRCHYVSVCCRI